MKNLHKKIGAMVLAGMVVAGGFAVSGINIHANAVDNFSSEQLDIAFLSRALYGYRNRIQYGYEMVGFNVGLNNMKPEEHILSFSDPYDFFGQISGSARKALNLDNNKVYYGRIKDLIFQFRLK